uniref:L-rhamnose-binding lectin CSL2-like n=1 Tax=Sinocyclocheilus rhinocerous TaxID=307959 RepID=A0A673M0M9_9TELE
IFCCFLTVVLLNSRLLISLFIMYSIVIVVVLTVIHYVLMFFFCSDTGVISVQSATCGRTSSQICSVGRPPSETSNTQCSIDVPAVFKRLLIKCELNTQGLAPKDPCFGTYKYYTTNYICIPAGLDFFYLFLQFQFFIISFSVYLKCENGKIQINTANYGRTDKTTCSEGRPSEQLQNTNCYSPNALAPVCNGLKSCEVFATHTVFTDPCFGIYKYLAISYYCLPPGVREYLFCRLLLNSFNFFPRSCV